MVTLTNADPAMKTPEMTAIDSVRENLKKLKEDFGSYERLTESLQQLPGFEGINLTTVFRWITTKSEPPKKAAKAVLLMTRRMQQRPSIRLAVPKVYWMLPLMALTWDESSDQHAPKANGAKRRRHNDDIERPFGWFKDKKVDCVVTDVAIGIQAITLMEEGAVDVAIAGRELAASHPGITLLCQFTEAELKGLTLGKIHNIKELHHRECVFQEGSVILNKIEDLKACWGGIDMMPRSFQKSEEIASYLFQHKNDKSPPILLGWEPLLHRVETASCKQGLALHPLKFDALVPRVPTINCSLFINKEICDPAAIRVLLSGLKISTRYFSMVAKTNDSDAELILKNEIEPHLKADPMPTARLLELIRSCRFELTCLDTGIVVSLWEKEVNRTAIERIA